jgi:hypothetical protein
MNAAYLNLGPAVAPGNAIAKGTHDFVRLLSLDVVTIDRPRLACHWHRDIDGRLTCRWESDTVPSAPPVSEFRLP